VTEKADGWQDMGTGTMFGPTEPVSLSRQGGSALGKVLFWQ